MVEAATERAKGSEAAGADSPRYATHEPLPDVLTRLSRPGVLARLENASRRGKLPGFGRRDPEGLCHLAAFGDPFDKVLIVIADDEPDGRLRLRWRSRLSWKMPALLAGLLAISIWPGEPLTDSVLRTYFGFYNRWTNPAVEGAWLRTWMWYLPLAVPSALWVWRAAMQRTARSTHQSAHEAVRKVAEAVNGELTAPRIRSGA